MDNTSTQKNKVLVAGASGLLGVAATEKFLSAGWDLIGVSRRKPDLPAGEILSFCQSICVTKKQRGLHSSC